MFIGEIILTKWKFLLGTKKVPKKLEVKAKKTSYEIAF